jgi:hypothetical protein
MKLRGCVRMTFGHPPDRGGGSILLHIDVGERD